MDQKYWQVPERPLEPPEYREPRCPLCGEIARAAFRRGGETVGCDNCLKRLEAYELEEFYGE